MKKILRKVYHFLILLKRLNITKTLYFNFKVLPFRKAVKLPFFLYGKIYIGDLSGAIEIPDEFQTGMIRIGYKWFDLWPVSFLPTQIQVAGRLKFLGAAVISGGANINVQSKKGLLTIGKDVLIGGGSVCKCLEKIEIGNWTRVTGNCNIMDCNMHFVKNIDTGVVANYKAPIIIGENCWINYGTVISKGAVVPDYSISARNSYLSKDYSEYGTNLFLVGSPAKPTSSKVQRIFTIEKQQELAEYFETHDVQSIQLEPGIEKETGTREGF